LQAQHSTSQLPLLTLLPPTPLLLLLLLQVMGNHTGLSIAGTTHHIAVASADHAAANALLLLLLQVMGNHTGLSIAGSKHHCSFLC
jgi:hypothetical protein